MPNQVFIFEQIEFEKTIGHPYVLKGFKNPGQIKWWRGLLISFYHYRKVVKILAFERK